MNLIKLSCTSTLLIFMACGDQRDIVSLESKDFNRVDAVYVSEYLSSAESALSLFEPLGSCVSGILYLDNDGGSLIFRLFRLSDNRYRYFSETEDITIDVEPHESLESVVREFAALEVLRNGPGIPRMIEVPHPRCWNILTKTFEVSWRLSDLLQVQSTLNETVVATIAYKTLRVLRFAHNRGILHNMVCSDSILVSRNLDIQLIKWGWSSHFVEPKTGEHVLDSPTSRKDDYIALFETLFFAQTGANLSDPQAWININPFSPLHGMFASAKNLTYFERPPYEGTMSDFQWYVNILSGVDLKHVPRRR